LIISYKFKFILILVPKTASTSLQVALGSLCGDDDVITSDGAKILAQGKKYGFTPRNYLQFRKHDSARIIKNRVPEEVWNNYFKFAFERNPYDKMVSKYSMLLKSGDYQGDFKQFCIDCVKGTQSFPIGYKMYTIKDKIAVDYIGKYESLKKDFKFICKKLGIPFEGDLPKLRADKREDKKHFSKYYDSETKEIVKNHYQKEIEMFGYSL